MKPKVDGAQIQVYLVSPLYKSTLKVAKDETGKPAVDVLGNKIKVQEDRYIKEVFLKQWFYKEDIRVYGEYVGSKGQTVKNRCVLFNKYQEKPYIAAHSVKELHDAINENRASQIGFKR